MPFFGLFLLELSSPLSSASCVLAFFFLFVFGSLAGAGGCGLPAASFTWSGASAGFSTSGSAALLFGFAGHSSDPGRP